METDAIGIDEVMVVAYGTKRKGGVTGSVAVIESEAFDSKPISSFDQMIQGTAPGVQVVTSNGAPGSTALINIRGIGSISAGNEPLFVLDGVPVSSNSFTELNPNDIESISILKDASAASLYGSRASNGVILITSKRGRQGDSKIEIRYRRGLNVMNKPGFEMMDASEKLQYEMDLGFRTGADAAPAVIDSLTALGHDWIETLSRDGMVQSVEAAVSGGTEKTSYFMSIQKYDEEGIVELSEIHRLSARVNVDHKVLDNFKIGNTFTVGTTNMKEIRDRRNVQNPFAAMTFYNAYEPEYLPNGDYNKTHQGFSISEALVNNPEDINQLVAIGTLYAEWTIIPGLTFTTRGGINFREYTREYYTQPGSILAQYVGDGKTDNWNRRYTYTWANTLSYNKTFDEVHNINVLGGMEYNQYYFQSMFISGEGFPSAKLSTQANAATITDGDTQRQDWSLASYFASASYDYDQKYVIEGSFRRDGSSRFGADNKWGNFWSAGVSWNLHREIFMQNIAFLDRFQLRASTGTSGNFNIGNYASMGLYGFGSYNGLSASFPTQLENNNLTWEKAMISSAGIDFSLFGYRLNGTVEVYNRDTKSLLLNKPLSATSGFTGRNENIGELNNKGIEFALNGDVIRTSDFDWNVGFMVSHNKNEVTKLYGDEGEPITERYTIIEEGRPINTFYMVRWAGVNPANGEALYLDKDGEVTNVWSGDDLVALDKTSDPVMFGTVNTSVSWKGISLSASAYFSYKNYIVNGISYFTMSDGGDVQSNQDVRMLDYWKQPGDVVNNPAPSIGKAQHYTNRYLEDASFLRLRDVTISYNFPATLLQIIRVRSLRVYFTGRNMLTFCPYFTGYDPEVGLPSQESSTDAANGSFYDFSYPATKSFTFGVDIGF
jgi:TonB-linked SusC/RagA family outer membrane protein